MLGSLMNWIIGSAVVGVIGVFAIRYFVNKAGGQFSLSALWYIIRNLWSGKG